MKISISFPPLESEKGTPCLTQNRQFQWFNNPTYIYPVIPAYAAALLKQNGYDVFWDDGIAEELSYPQWKERLVKEKPDIIFIETKTPVVKRHWKIINELREASKEIRELGNLENWDPKIVLAGDHVTALPRESLENSQVDYAICGGDFDFILLSIANKLSRKNPADSRGEFEGGVWHKDENNQIQNSGAYDLHTHSLDELPMIDRELTKWKLYGYKNGNFKHQPGAYMMSARDCWWGKCSFCVDKNSLVFTLAGSKTIDKIHKGERVLTHLGNYKKVREVLQREYSGEILNIKTHCLLPFKITPKHKILSLPQEKIVQCSQKGNGMYICKSNYEFSKRVKCDNCNFDYPFNDYRLYAK